MYFRKSRIIKEPNFREKFSNTSLIKPRDAWYDGEIYASFIERHLSGIHNVIIKKGTLLEANKVIDIGCGTGGFLLKLAATSSGKQPVKLVGIDLSPSNIKKAQERFVELKSSRNLNGNIEVEFYAEDAMDLGKFENSHFDVCTLCLCLHEMPSAHRIPVLKEASRVAKRVVICDWPAQMPYSLAGFRNRLAEFIAGPDHFSGFLDFTKRGGTVGIIKDSGLELKWSFEMDGGTMILAEAQGVVTAQPSPQSTN